MFKVLGLEFEGRMRVLTSGLEFAWRIGVLGSGLSHLCWGEGCTYWASSSNEGW